MTGAELISAERQRQIEREGFTAKHDDHHDDGELLIASLCYAGMAGIQINPDGDRDSKAQAAHMAVDAWPWEERWWKPADNPVRNLVKAGALIAAEIDRLQRKIQ